MVAYEKNSLSLAGAVAMGTGVMVGAGIFALTGQVAGLAGAWFPLSLVLAAGVSGLSAHGYIAVSRKYPSAGGIAMILSKAYGPTAVAAWASMLMVFSMSINESLVARTFGTYSLQLFGLPPTSLWVPVLALAVIVVGFGVNLAGTSAIGTVSKIGAVVKVGGLVAFAVATLVAAGFDFQAADDPEITAGPGGWLAAIALGILAYKGFTTIATSGDEIRDPHRNVGRAIVISLLICVVVYLLVAFAVGSSLTIAQIVEAQDYSLAAASRPAFGDAGVVFTVLIAIVATVTGLLASFFAVSRMLAMLTDMELIPHRHFGMPGGIQQHTLVYTVVIAGVLAVLFDLSRIAAIGAIFYLVMDIAVQWGILRHLRQDVGAKPVILVAAILADAVALVAFVVLRGQQDLVVIAGALVAVAVLFAFQVAYLRHRDADSSKVA